MASKIELTEARYKSRVEHFKKPLVCDLTVDRRWFVIHNKRLDITTSGATLEKAKENFTEELFFLIDEYLHEKDENLTEGAQDLKRKLEAIIDVEPAKNTKGKSCSRR